MEKRLEEIGKNLCTEEMEGEINTETERTTATTCDNDQSTSCDVDPLSITTNGQCSSHVDGIKKVKVSIHNVFTLVYIPNLSIELCTVAICKDLLIHVYVHGSLWYTLVQLLCNNS